MALSSWAPKWRASSRFTESYELHTSDFTRLTGSLDFDSENEILNTLDKLQQAPKILREGILATGSPVAILLQAAAHGMARTATRVDANGETKTLAEQLYQSIHAVAVRLYGLTFGTRRQRKQILDRIYSSHQPTRNRNGNHGTRHLRPYPDDPKLRLWVAATLYATGMELYQRVFDQLGFQEAEQAYSEFTVLVTIVLDLPEGVWPINRAAFWNYWDQSVEKLDVDTRALPVVHDLETFRNMPSWVRMSIPLMKNITPEMLPPHVREQYGFQSSSTSRFKYRLYMNGAKLIYPSLPGAIRCIPKRRVMKDVEKMLRES